MTYASAPGKIILCGEHAVVYGCPAIALPLQDIRAAVTITHGTPGSGIRIHSIDLDREWLVEMPPSEPLGELILSTLQCQALPTTFDTRNLTITIESPIPIASGMGSGAAVATALVRALVAHSGHPNAISTADISALVYSCEKRYHGTPSGIDNAVIAFEQPIWFVRQQPVDGTTTAALSSTEKDTSPIITPLSITTPLHLVIADTGIRSKTSLPVGEVRRRWHVNPTTYNRIFRDIEALVHQIRAALTSNVTNTNDSVQTIGTLLNANQQLLEEMGVSSPELERLIAVARAAGALGAKLSGAGWGGVMIALAEPTPTASETLANALRYAGAPRVLTTTVGNANSMSE